MRSVKKTSRATRTESRRGQPRRATRTARPTAERNSFGRRRSNGTISLFFERVKHWLAAGHPMLWLSGALLLVVLVGGVAAGGYVRKTLDAGGRAVDQVIADAGFGIASVHLAGNHRTSASDILTALGYEPGQSIFSADVAAARNRLLALPWVFDAEVRRQYPDSISVDIVERIPFALWQTPNLLYVVERSGRTITVATSVQFPRLPLLIGEGAPQASADLIDAVALHRAISARLKGMQRVSDRRWNLILDGNVVVQLPEEGWQKELDVLEHLIVDEGVLERDVTEIDLREKDNYFFILRNGQKQQAARGNAA